MIQPLGAGTFEFRGETGLGGPSTSAYCQDSDPSWDWDRTDLRHFDFAYSGSFG